MLLVHRAGEKVGSRIHRERNKLVALLRTVPFTHGAK